jgi:hypothetical protein
VLCECSTKNAQVSGVDTFCQQFLASLGVPGVKLHQPRQAEANGHAHFCLVSWGTITYFSNGSKKTTFSLAYGMLTRREDTAKRESK